MVKDTPARQLADAVRRVHAGLRVVDPALAPDSLVSGESPLTPRETEVLRAAREGSSAATIAARLYLSEGTVRNHLSAAIGKTGRAPAPRRWRSPRATAGSGPVQDGPAPDGPAQDGEVPRAGLDEYRRKRDPDLRLEAAVAFPGTATSMPPTSVNSVLPVLPLRLFPLPRAAGSCF